MIQFKKLCGLLIALSIFGCTTTKPAFNRDWGDFREHILLCRGRF